MITMIIPVNREPHNKDLEVIVIKTEKTTELLQNKA